MAERLLRWVRFSVTANGTVCRFFLVKKKKVQNLTWEKWKINMSAMGFVGCKRVKAKKQDRNVRSQQWLTGVLIVIRVAATPFSLHRITCLHTNHCLQIIQIIQIIKRCSYAYGTPLPPDPTRHRTAAQAGWRWASSNPPSAWRNDEAA